MKEELVHVVLGLHLARVRALGCISDAFFHACDAQSAMVSPPLGVGALRHKMCTECMCREPQWDWDRRRSGSGIAHAARGSMQRAGNRHAEGTPKKERGEAHQRGVGDEPRQVSRDQSG